MEEKPQDPVRKEVILRAAQRFQRATKKELEEKRVPSQFLGSDMFFLIKIDNLQFSIVYLNFILLFFLCLHQDQKIYGNFAETLKELEYQKAKIIFDYHDQRYHSLLEVKEIISSKELLLEKMHYEVSGLDLKIAKLKNQFP